MGYSLYGCKICNSIVRFIEGIFFGFKMYSIIDVEINVNKNRIVYRFKGYYVKIIEVLFWWLVLR